MNKIPKWLTDALMEGLRLLVLGVLAYLISGQELTGTAIWTIGLKIVDKLMHKYGKEEDIGWLITGLTRF